MAGAFVSEPDALRFARVDAVGAQWLVQYGGYHMSVEIYVSRRPGYSQMRRHTRVPTSFPVRLVSPSLRLADEARDLSESGIGVLTKHPLDPMTLVPVRLELPTEREPIEVLSRVMWATQDAMGLRFEQPDDRLHDSVQRLRAAMERI